MAEPYRRRRVESDDNTVITPAPVIGRFWDDYLIPGVLSRRRYHTIFFHFGLF